MIVMKLTAKSGEVYYNADHSPQLVAATLKHCPDWQKVELVEMSEAEYYSIPTNNEAAQLFTRIMEDV